MWEAMESLEADFTAEVPEDVLARILQQLTAAHLHRVEAVCRRFRAVVVQHELWRQACEAVHRPLCKLLSHIDISGVPQPGAQLWLGAEAVRRSLFFKRLHYRLTAPQARESLIATTLAASTTDHPQESIDHLLSPEARSDDLLCYWSSAGSDDEDSVEVLTFVLAHPLCLVREIDLRPFRAFFQWEHPIYSPKAVRFRLGGLECFGARGLPLPKATLLAAVQRELGIPTAPPAAAAAAGVVVGQNVAMGQNVVMGGPHLAAAAPGAALGLAIPLGGPSGSAAAADPFSPPEPWVSPQAVWQSPVFAVRQADELQRFEIEPTLCVGGLLQVELLGKVQRQDPDQLLYACLAYVRALGVPIYNFFAEPASARALAGVQQQQQQQQSEQQGAQAPGLGPATPGLPASGLAAAATTAAVLPSSEPSLVSLPLQQAQLTAGQPGRQQAQGQQQEAGPEPPAPLQLCCMAADPLLQAGGLMAVSEGGRILRLRQRAHALVGAGGELALAGQGGGGGGGEADWDDEDGNVWGESDSDSVDEDGFEGLELVIGHAFAD